MASNVRHAVAVEATGPNRSACSRKTFKSEMQSPPSASITARSRSTWPGSWPLARRRVAAMAAENASVRPIRSATCDTMNAPAWDTMPVPSEVTRIRRTRRLRCTREVPL